MLQCMQGPEPSQRVVRGVRRLTSPIAEGEHVVRYAACRLSNNCSHQEQISRNKSLRESKKGIFNALIQATQKELSIRSHAAVITRG